MTEYTTTRATRFLPQMMVATVVVAVAPVVLGWWLRAGGVISSAWLCVVVALALSLALSAGGSYWWTRRRKAADILFSELLVWGWLRRYRVERQLAGATALLGLLPGAEPAAGADDVVRREQLLRQLGAALDAQDPYLDGHSRRVARYATTVARRMGLPEVQLKTIRAAAAVHDVGKLRVPPELLRKATPLTDAEFEAVMRHADEGAEMVSCLGDDELTEIVRHHHERFDGLGYPAGLRGVAIPLGARIVAVADTFDAITSARPYRPAARHKQAIDVLVANAGTQLDPNVVRAFLRCYAGRKASVMWVILAVSPQRAFAWMRHGGGGGEPVPVVPVGELAASTVGRALVVAAAVGTSVGVGVARYETHLPSRGTGLPVAAAAPSALPLGPGPTAASKSSRPAASGRGAVSRAADPSGHPRPSTGALTKRTRVLTSASRSTTGNHSATRTGGTVSGGGGGGSTTRTSARSGGLGTGVSPGGSKPITVQPPHGQSAPAVTAPARTPGGNGTRTPVAPQPPPPSISSGPAAPPTPTPPPPGPPGGGGDQGGGPPDGGGGPGGPKHGGPGHGGWGPVGHPHGGPGNGGWGPDGNPHGGPGGG